jgi:hypothetical protein
MSFEEQPRTPNCDTEDLLPEYDFARGVRGKHQEAYKAGTNVVLLDPDVGDQGERGSQ